VLDFLKGALPVAAAYWVVGLDGWSVTPLVLAPVLGHAFPVFERFRGGKALTVTFGVWAGITIWEVPSVVGAAMAAGKLLVRFKEDAHSVLLGMAVLVLYVVLRYRSLPLSAAAVLCATVVIWRHRRELVRS
jgi:glycerol-3-phosphate acyltransferase PlsY